MTKTHSYVWTLLALPFCVQSAYADQSYVNKSIYGAVTCKLDALNVFNGSLFDGSSDGVDAKLRAAQVRFDDEDDSDEVRFKFPSETKLFGYRVIDGFYSARVVTTFVVRLDATPRDLPRIRSLLKLKPVPRGNPDGYGYFLYFDVKYLRKLKGTGDIPDTIIAGIRREHGKAYIVVGCQNLAW